MRLETQNTATLRLANNGGGVVQLAPLGRGAQGLPGPGAAAWTALQAVTTGSVRQAPDGSWIKSLGNRTTRASFDATEETFWEAVLASSGTVEAAALTASIAAPVSPVAVASATSTHALTGGAAGIGKKVIAGETVAGKLVFEIATAESNGYTTLNLFPSNEDSRTKISVWAKSPDDLGVGETNPRLFSLEAHSTAEEGVSHFTMYAQMKSGMTDQNGRGTVAGGGPLIDYQGHVFQVATEAQWDNRFELLTFLQAKGLMPVDLWDDAAGAYAGLSDEAGTYATFMLANGNAAQVATIQNRSGVFQFATGASGSIKLTSAGGIVHTAGQTYIDDNSTGLRVRGVLPAVTGGSSQGFWFGRISTDNSQPTFKISNGTDAQQFILDNRVGIIRFIVNATTPTVPLQIGAGSIGFGGTTPVAFSTGWALPTGTTKKTTYDTATVTLPELAGYVMAMAQAFHQTAGVGLLRS